MRDSVSSMYKTFYWMTHLKLRCLFGSKVVTFFCSLFVTFYYSLFQRWKVESINSKRVIREKNIGLRICQFCLEMVNSQCAGKGWFVVFATHCWCIQVKISSSILLFICSRGAHRGGSVANAVCVSDIWQVTGDMQHVTPQT